MAACSSVADDKSQSTASPPGGLVVVALDGSDHAEKALNWYANHVHRQGYSVLLLNIANPPYVKSEQIIYMSDDLWKEMMTKEKLKFKDIEVHYARLLEKRKLPGSIRTVFYDDYSAGIAEVAEEEGALMIVMGSHGKGMEQRALGSVTEKVTRKAHCPVLVWRHDHCSHTSNHWDKVLVYM